MGASPLHAACCEFLFPQQVHMVAFAIVCGPVANLSQADCWVSLPCVSVEANMIKENPNQDGFSAKNTLHEKAQL
jgi:hypothetical protein